MVTIIEEALNFNSNHSERVGTPKGIVLHHAAGNGSVRDVHSWHQVRGWAGIGYHFYVRKDGKVYRGRPENWIGAHTVGYNDRLGICAEGNFETENMPDVQKNAIVELVRYLIATYGELAIKGHRELASTACPGKKYPFDEIVKAATAETTKAAVEDTLVLKFQKAALADGLTLSKYGTDGLWGSETAGAASKILVYGSKGERVKLAQNILLGLGSDLGSAGADGVFGSKTLAAVKAFQGTKGLAADGIIGVNTWKALLNV